MEINFMRPSTVWVGKRCYRVLNTITSDNAITNYTENDAYGFEDSVYQDEVECASEMPEYEVERLDNGKYQTSVPVASGFFSYIIGTKGATKKRIENDTYTQLRVPSKGQTGDIVIVGRDIKTVRQARIKVELLVEQARRKMPFTHFLSMPINSSSVQERFLEFKREVLEKFGNERGIDESLFQDPAKLHLTLCVMALADDRERRRAIDVLNSCTENVLRKHLSEENLKVQMKGVEYMNDDPNEVDVLYGQVHALSWGLSLQTIVDSLVDQFVNAGVVIRQHERVKLHVTLMNTLFRQEKEGITENRGKERESFAAKQILEEFKDYIFGEVEIKEIHLSLRHTTANNGFYSASARIPIGASCST
ncbi:activating signal cointegrator 1 complex subunit 1-like isoform X1 [Palaemon carinicauda]|uniref:activating signal cointegrator 1 complex subunit 1-like isoform X1 n=2 Tax=Palaemon carinicauda TaxID=392227 RepID=UPI0035B6793E